MEGSSCLIVFNKYRISCGAGKRRAFLVLKKNLSLFKFEYLEERVAKA
jgi:hypothetical protein